MEALPRTPEWGSPAGMPPADSLGVNPMRSAPHLAGREAAYLLRVLAAARSRGLPLLPAVDTTADLEGLRQLRLLLPVLRERGEENLLDEVVAALGRGWTHRRPRCWRRCGAQGFRLRVCGTLPTGAALVPQTAASSSGLSPTRSRS